MAGIPPLRKGIITLREALNDFLREQGLTIDDVLDAMDEDPRGIIESLLARVDMEEREAERLERVYGARQLNLLIFVIHLFYYANPSGLYKGFLIYPPRELVVGPTGKVTRKGLELVLRSLGLVPAF